jgi:hypothetical protein
MYIPRTYYKFDYMQDMEVLIAYDFTYQLPGKERFHEQGTIDDWDQLLRGERRSQARARRLCLYLTYYVN